MCDSIKSINNGNENDNDNDNKKGNDNNNINNDNRDDDDDNNNKNNNNNNNNCNNNDKLINYIANPSIWLLLLPLHIHRYPTTHSIGNLYCKSLLFFTSTGYDSWLPRH